MFGYYNNYGYNYQQNTSSDERIWVQNAQAAEAYLVAPNSFVRLWDSTKNVFYEKRTDSSGRPMPMECFSYEKIVTKTEAEVPQPDVWMEKINSLEVRIRALEGVENESNGDDATVSTVQEQL